MSDSQIKSTGSSDPARVPPGPLEPVSSRTSPSTPQPPLALPPVLPSKTQVHCESLQQAVGRSEADPINPALKDNDDNARTELANRVGQENSQESLPPPVVNCSLAGATTKEETAIKKTAEPPKLALNGSSFDGPFTVQTERLAESPTEQDAENLSSVGTSLQPSEATEPDPLAQPAATKLRMRWYKRPFWFAGRVWDFVGLLVLLAVVAAVPIVQLASLGYLLVAGANLAARRPWADSLPGLRTAGKMMTFAGIAALLWLPVWLVTDFAYSAQLLQPGSPTTTAWRVGAFVISGVWVTHLVWAAARGARWWHLLWPAPIAFVRRGWRPSTWSKASDELYEFVVRLHFPRLWWLGARAAVGALLWTTLPVSLMIIGLRGEEVPAAGLWGFLGAVAMAGVMLYLPYLQIQLAETNRFASLIDVPAVRRRFRFAPLSHAFAMFFLVLLCIPLYLLRIEATPEELTWAPALVFVLFMLPAKILLGAAMGYASGRSEDGKRIRHWALRWSSRFVGLAVILIYVGALYVSQLIASQGAYVMYFQHAFLVPAPQF